MINFSKFDCILWDFDGVLIDSMPVRDVGFSKVLSNFPSEQVEELLEYHRNNGGLSRYVKFRYFFENIRREKVSDETILEYARRFSDIMLSELINPALLITETIDFVGRHHARVDMHIVSGSDGEELKEICRRLNLSPFFKSIHGSPTPKIELVSRILKSNSYKQVLLIGDSLNDLEASKVNSIAFAGYNNIKLKSVCPTYIENFQIISFDCE
jgi:phosphoglycolate phosphatase-like HAD superfamily hydrolase